MTRESSLEECLAEVRRILVEDFEIEAEKLRPEASLFEDMGLDSLDAVDLVVAIERAFKCRLDEQRVRKLRKLQDVYDLVGELVGAGKGSP